VIFNGIALENPTPTGIQRFRVSRYLKGRGPLIVRVSTGNIRRADGTGSVTSVSIVVHRGERWQIFEQAIHAERAPDFGVRRIPSPVTVRSRGGGTRPLTGTSSLLKSSGIPDDQAALHVALVDEAVVPVAGGL